MVYVSTSTERMRRHRERKAAEHAAALAAVPDAPPRDPEELLLSAVETALAALKLGERDAAAAALARHYARRMDEAQDQAAAARVLGPLLHKVLEALGGTPASRAGRPVAPPQRRQPNRVAELRAAHAQTKARRARAAAR